MAAVEAAPEAHIDQPYPGLRSFETSEEFLFYGRESHNEQLLRRLSENRLLAVVGSSGSGKSSLVRAGLLPALYRGRLIGATSRWRICVMRPGGAPLDNLAETLAEEEIFSTDKDAVRKELSRSSLGLVRALRAANFAEGESLLLVVDQFEELFRFVRERKEQDGGAEARLFVASLLEAADLSTAAIYVVLTMRSDYIGDCTQFSGLPEALNRGQYLIPRLTREQVRDAIEKPLRVAGARMSPRLVDRLLNELDDDTGQLPVLQHALNRTFHQWRAAGGAGEVTVDHYVAAGTLQGALDDHANGLLTSLGEAEPWAEPVFRCLTTVEGGRKIRRATRLDSIYDAVGAKDDPSRNLVLTVIQRYSRRDDSLLVWSGKGLRSDSIVDISHESLIAHWEKLGQWVEAEAKAAEWYGSAANDAAWGRRTWRDPELSTALSFLAKGIWNPDWAARLPGCKVPFPVVEEFIQRGKAEQQKEQDTEEARREKEIAGAHALAETERRAKRWLIVAAVFLLLATAACAWSRQQEIAARNKLNEADKREFELRRELNGLDANLNKTASAESEIRTQLKQANQSASQREELQKQLAQLAIQKDVLEKQRADAESQARAEADTRARLQTQANVQQSDYALAQKRIADLETALKKAQDDAAQASPQTIAELRLKVDDLQKRLNATSAIPPAVRPSPSPVLLAPVQSQPSNSDVAGSSGSPKPKADAKSLELYRKGADAGEPRAMTELGYLYEDGRGGLPKDYAKAVELFRKAADAGEPRAMAALGYMYEEGLGVPKDDTKAVELYRKASGVGEPLGTYRLAYMYHFGRGGLPKDQVKAVELNRKAADAGNAEAMSNLGTLYRIGEVGVPQDDAKAVELYRKAADTGNSEALNNLGFMYQSGRGGLAKDDKKAVELYSKAADAGNSNAMYNLATGYESGRGGLAKDGNKALELYSKAADAGNSNAMNRLADMYTLGGGGLARDGKKAMELYRKAADAGDSTAMNNLAQLYQSGFDYTKAVELYRKAADAGNSTAMRNLAIMYDLGRGGLRKDKAKAKQLRQQAAQLSSQQ